MPMRVRWASAKIHQPRDRPGKRDKQLGAVLFNIQDVPEVRVLTQSLWALPDKLNLYNNAMMSYDLKITMIHGVPYLRK